MAITNAIKYAVKINEIKFPAFKSCLIVGNALAFGLVAQVFTVIFEGGDLNVSLIQGLYASVGNILIEAVVGIPVIKLLANRYASRSNLTEE